MSHSFLPICIQGPDSYWRCTYILASEHLSQIYHMMGMSQILTERQNHYIMVYGLNTHGLKDEVVGHLSTYARTIEDCFSNIHAVGARYKRVEGYSWADFHATEASGNEITSTKEPGPYFKFLKQMHRSKSYSNDKFLNYKKIDNPHKSQQNYHNSR